MAHGFLSYTGKVHLDAGRLQRESPMRECGGAFSGRVLTGLGGHSGSCRGLRSQCEPEKQSGPMGGVCSPNQYLLKFIALVGGGDDSLGLGAPQFLSEATTVFQMCLSKLALSLSSEIPMEHAGGEAK